MCGDKFPAGVEIMPNKSLDEFPNIVVHSGVFTKKTGNTEVTFSVENYQEDVMQLLKKLRWKFTGWALFCEILRQRGKTMLITPYTAGMESLSPTDTNKQAVDKLKKNFNATAGPKNWSDATPKGQQPLSCGGSNQNQTFGAGTGTGTGSDAIVKFTPGMWTSDQVEAAFGKTNAKGPGVGPDEILLHEMTHGMRQMTGTSLCSATPDQPGLDTVEEFMAILVSNVYRSEILKTDLRQDHWGFIAMKPTPTSQEFLDANKGAATNNKQRMDLLKSQHAQFCTNMKKVPATFNPFLLL